ncbi:hypothetical protein [Rhodanobacter denitrificans]|uniref:hypothetical protein n=1 Tax=Rhodanobacter denitrificans TaxID=666685 RepID=UPI0011C03215|nr:hypothetical protein [Rhodanobacter denitrificans]
MNKNYVYLSLLDWSENISVEAILNAINEVFPGFMGDLEVGRISIAGRVRKFKTSFIKHYDEARQCDYLEWFGGVKSKNDPASNWSSYLMIRCHENRELLLCKDGGNVSFDAFVLLLTKIASIGNIGYGYASISNFGTGIVYDAMGITNGYPTNECQKAAAEKSSRWFMEKISMGGRPARRRYLTGMYKDVYEINVLNATHIKNESEALTGVGEIIRLNSKSYLWLVKEADLLYARRKLDELKLII